ncbi:hypothetical protein M0Q50_05005 [bacterium]|jgi:esterase/lipase|nr:hypothetical protein [bacterium]
MKNYVREHINEENSFNKEIDDIFIPINKEKTLYKIHITKDKLDRLINAAYLWTAKHDDMVDFEEAEVIWKIYYKPEYYKDSKYSTFNKKTAILITKLISGEFFEPEYRHFITDK